MLLLVTIQTHIDAAKDYWPLDQFDITKPAIISTAIATKHRCPQCNVRARTVLWYLAFTGFAINYMIRINVNITIVDMVQPLQQQTSTSNIGSECLLANQSSTLSAVAADNQPSVTASAKLPTFTPESWLLGHPPTASHPKFAWNARQQGALLGSFFWLHWALQIPGGLLARRYGTKLVFGLANLIGCALCALLPLAAHLDLRWLIGLRVLQGLVCGVAWPAMHTMTGRWIPPNERSKFVTAYMGSSIGVAAFYPAFGYVMAVAAWEWVYHLCAAVGAVWFAAWWWLAFDSPAQHPRICADERRYIEESLGIVAAATTTDGAPLHRPATCTPWRQLLTSRPVLVIVIAQWGGVWGLFTLMTQAPTYFRNVHGWTVSATGLLSGLPHLMRMACALVCSWLGDWLLSSGRMQRTNVRRLAGAVCLLANGAFMVGLAFAGCNAWLAVALLVAATAMHGAVSTGPLAGLVDLSPNYSGITMGVSGMVSVMPGFISPYIVGQLTLGNVSGVGGCNKICNKIITINTIIIITSM